MALAHREAYHESHLLLMHINAYSQSTTLPFLRLPIDTPNISRRPGKSGQKLPLRLSFTERLTFRLGWPLVHETSPSLEKGIMVVCNIGKFVFRPITVEICQRIEVANSKQHHVAVVRYLPSNSNSISPVLLKYHYRRAVTKGIEVGDPRLRIPSKPWNPSPALHLLAAPHEG